MPSLESDSRPRTRSLRSRWNRAFALLTAIVIVSGLAGLVGTKLVVDTFRGSALRMASEGATSAQLRAEVVAQSVLVSSPVTPTWSDELATARAQTGEYFAQAIAVENTPQAKSLLEQSLQEWRAIVSSEGAPGRPQPVAVRGLAVSTHAPKALAFLDRAALVNRAAVRDDLASATRTYQEALAVLAFLDLLALAVAVALSRRLSTQVLRPLGALRDSTNELAAGQLDHRVVLDRDDELGDLAVSFNAMADSMAGSQRSLTLEANTDSLSGLANRAAFSARLQASLDRTDRRGIQALLFVDLDDFKDVNDTLGHAAGDELLRVVAARLSAAVRPGDAVSRLGGDEFAVLLDSLPHRAFAREVAQRIVTALSEPVRLGDRWAHVGASVGLAMCRPDSTLVGIMREADVAMYAAKAKGKNRVEAYDADLDELTIARHNLRSELQGVAARGELVLEYQPVVDLDTGFPVGVEALVRWQHPTRGLLPPSEFVEAAEQTGAIVEIGTFVLETAARQVRFWQRRYGLPEFWLAVNVSVCQLDRPRFAQEVGRILRRARFDPRALVLEVTETVLADPKGEVAQTLASLRETGARVALDDFGTGYASIGYLRRLPLDILKIDRSFVAGTSADSQANALLEAIVAMAERLGLEVVPEGIEEVDQLTRLRAMGCHIGQGFLLSRPMTVDGIEAVLAAPIPLAHIGIGAPVPLG
jgi:diguanylate cyclase (GGDEF)-like protein